MEPKDRNTPAYFSSGFTPSVVHHSQLQEDQIKIGDRCGAAGTMKAGLPLIIWRMRRVP